MDKAIYGEVYEIAGENHESTTKIFDFAFWDIKEKWENAEKEHVHAVFQKELKSGERRKRGEK